MAAYLNEHVSQDALIETLEEEIGFLTDHNCHFPPLLVTPEEKQAYDFVQREQPEYVLIGWFGRESCADQNNNG